MNQPAQEQSSLQLPIRAVPLTLFPTLGSLQEVVDLAESKLPITSKNELTSLLFTYHNTLLSELLKANDVGSNPNQLTNR